MARGGFRKGAGRKTKAEELGLKATLDEVFTDEAKKEVFDKLLSEAKKGSIAHAQLLLAYYYGKPSEHVVSDVDNETTIRIVRGDTDNSSETTCQSTENT